MRPVDKGVAKAFVLKILMDGSVHGYEIMRRIKEVTGFAPSPGHIYTLLRKLEKEGLVDVSVSYIGGRKIKTYRLSDKGRRFLEDNKALLTAANMYVNRFRKAKEVELHKLFEVIHSIFESLDKMPSDKMRDVRDAIESFTRRINEIIGG